VSRNPLLLQKGASGEADSPRLRVFQLQQNLVKGCRRSKPRDRSGNGLVSRPAIRTSAVLERVAVYRERNVSDHELPEYFVFSSVVPGGNRIGGALVGETRLKEVAPVEPQGDRQVDGLAEETALEPGILVRDGDPPTRGTQGRVKRDPCGEPGGNGPASEEIEVNIPVSRVKAENCRRCLVLRKGIIRSPAAGNRFVLRRDGGRQKHQ
jgi:hypothetical protein